MISVYKVTMWVVLLMYINYLFNNAKTKESFLNDTE
ncbi:uncharacterized protein METZ01_LOCUS252882, partial [marine metagenome]